jgi:PBP1b-binding outer membrane lipoprotein LpoB
MRSLGPRGRMAAAALAALTLTGCTAMKVRSSVAPGTDVRQYHTYAWGPTDALSTGDPRLDNNPFFDQRVRSALEKEMTAKGFEKATSGAPDLLIHYHAIVGRQTCVDCPADVYREDTLLVHVVDPRASQIVWSGWAEGIFVGAIVDNQDWMERRIDTAIARILKKLPPRR